LFHDFCRYIDDIADDRTIGTSEKQIVLNAWLRAIELENGSDLPSDFRDLIERRQLDRNLLGEIVKGVLMDTERNRYETIDELIPYCRRVASAVGLVSAGIFGATGVAVERYAEELGIALQLTNILRDVAEDAEMDRLYIPREDLERFGVSEEEILRKGNGIPSPAMIHLLNHQAERADSRFAKAELAWTEMSANQRRLMRPARLMSAIYRVLLLQMHRDRYDVFAKRYRVSGLKKVFLLLRVASTRS
jgi:phytoene synthase